MFVIHQIIRSSDRQIVRYLPLHASRGTAPLPHPPPYYGGGTGGGRRTVMNNVGEQDGFTSRLLRQVRSEHFSSERSVPCVMRGRTRFISMVVEARQRAQSPIGCRSWSRSTFRSAGRDIRTDSRSGARAGVARVSGSPLGRKGNRAARHSEI